MNDPKNSVFVRSGAAVIVLIGACACNVDGDEPVDDEKMIVITDQDIFDVDQIPAPPGPNMAVPNPSEVSLESIVANGTGCPAEDLGSVVSQLSNDLTSLTLRYNDMLLGAPAGPPGPPVNTVNCVVSAKIQVPMGWRFSLASIETRGEAALEQGLHARHLSDFFFVGSPGFDAVNELDGDIDARFVFVNTVPPGALTWSACGGSVLFAMNTSLVLNAINNPQGEGTDRVRTNKYIIQWQKC
ncbi:DUF4360 domain-containing protein [Enhygromyxa salina]|uniref:DUF4360 domain-containing protein n=1 Tax=Enhygromyxa salina TaxID=215803 RepID=A0A2S9YVL8_9BACT|nr:DUF4360 domain-containing protein [Enhygromyxa salina]PRQ09147.1 hypothetical protein ENSA7_11370 [Enhygromyxa salina]